MDLEAIRIRHGLQMMVPVGLETCYRPDLPKARVITYGYSSEAVHSPKYLCQQALYLKADGLISALASLRRRTSSVDKPIIFVAHSLGGLVVQSALVRLSMARLEDSKDDGHIEASTRGIVFLGTPQRSCEDTSFGTVIRSIVSTTSLKFRHFKFMEREAEWLRLQLEPFKSLSQSLLTCYCQETLSTELADSSFMIVPKTCTMMSGSKEDGRQILLASNHRNLCKFSRRDDPNYRRVKEIFSIIIEDVQSRVVDQWDHDKGIQTSSNSQAIPNGFKVPMQLDQNRNPNFIDQRNIMLRLYDRLNTKRQSITVLHGTCGVGKTQVACEYAYRHAPSFDSILWINAQSRSGLIASFLPDSAETCIPLCNGF